MPIITMAGRAKPVKDALLGQVRAAQREGDHPILMVVPAQYTLQAELESVGEGSFRLQVLSPSRLFARIFEAAGWPSGARIDEQGRVMLIHAAAQRLKGRLNWYQSAVGRRGFAEKVLTQLQGFKQARLAPDDVRALAEGAPDGAVRRKLADLALLYEGYEEALAGCFLDGEDEARQAAARMAGAAFLDGAEVYVYGFDIVSQPLAEALVSLCARARHVTVAFTLGADRRDEDIYAPIRHSRDRLIRLAREAGVEVRGAGIGSDERTGAADIRHLERELFCVPQSRHPEPPRHIQLAALKSPQDEAEFAAALLRQLAMDRGWRWRELAVMVQNLSEGYMSALRRAFALADVPLFLPASRPADRHPAAQCILAALRLLARGWRTEDMVAYLRAGFSGLTDDQLDALVNHILRRGLRGNALRNPLRYLAGDQQDLEAWRARAAAPLLALERRTKGEADARAVLTALFDFMEDLDLCGQIEQNQERLIGLELREWAMEGAQVYARILAAMDQMVDLLGGDRLTLRDAAQLLERALAVAEVKPLPQSGDAVACGSADHMKGQDVRALLILGLTDQGSPSDEGLLTEEEMAALGGIDASAELSPADRLRMERQSIKAALSFTGDYLLLCYPMSNARGEAVKPGALVGQVRRLFPRLAEHGGQTATEADRKMRHVRLNARQAARNRLPAMLRETPGDPYLAAVRDALGDGAADDFIDEPSALPGDLAAQLFGQIGAVSVSRLEKYAECPYQHFARYALRPEEFHEFELTPRDAGDFYHAAMERFIHENGERLSELSQAESMAQMDAVTEALMGDLVRQSLGEGAVARAQGEDLRQVARRAAATIVNQLSGSEFRPMALEIDFGQAEPRISLDGGARLGGRIDRVDGWSGDGGKYLRVIDYKTNGKALSLAEMYYGLQMQLMVYLSAATRQQNGKPAGAFYFNVSDRIVDVESTDPAVVDLERQKQLKLKGLMLKDEGVKAAMSDHPRDVLPVQGDALVAEGDMNLLMDHAMRKADELFRALQRGEIPKQPASIGDKLACERCDYRAMCQRDPGEGAQRLPKLRGAEVLARIRAELGHSTSERPAQNINEMKDP